MDIGFGNSKTVEELMKLWLKRAMESIMECFGMNKFNIAAAANLFFHSTLSSEWESWLKERSAALAAPQQWMNERKHEMFDWMVSFAGACGDWVWNEAWLGWMDWLVGYGAGTAQGN